MSHSGSASATADLVLRAIETLVAGFDPGPARVLDFGCGAGALVGELRQRGLAAEGCDFAEVLGDGPYLKAIPEHPYRLPFADGRFDLVVSTSVLEHVRDAHTAFSEIRRVLGPDGTAIHWFPSRWYLPREPHVRVPLANWFWPHTLRTWLGLWALVGVRNPFQEGLPWREVVRRNEVYLRDGVTYRSSREYDRISRSIFTGHEWPMQFYVEHSPGGAARLARRMPFRRASGRLLREVRESMLVQHSSGLAGG